MKTNLVKLFFGLQLFALPALAVSAYESQGPWINSKGESIQLSSFQGKAAVIALFYTSCRTICPMTVANLKKVEKALGKKAKDMHFILISIDSTNDSADKLASFAKTHKLDTARWHLVKADEERVRKLAGALKLGIGHQPADPDLHYMHSLQFAIVNAKGTSVETISTMEPDLERIRKLSIQ